VIDCQLNSVNLRQLININYNYVESNKEEKKDKNNRGYLIWVFILYKLNITR
jgi:hypothetical protein